MDITLLTIEPPGKKINRDYNAGLGTGFSVGRSLRAKCLERLRMRMEHLPFLTYGYLASIFRQGGHEVHAITNALPKKGVVVLAPSLVNFNEEVRWLEKVRDNPDLRSVVVGTLATVKPDLFENLADLVVTGEPEQFALDLGAELPTGVIQSPLVQNLDELPFPRWDLFHLRRQSYYLALRAKPFTFMQTSRSCPYKCSYCPYIVKTSYRTRSVENCIEELKDLVKDFGIRGIVFRDPTFTVNRERTEALCEAMIKEDLGIRWVCETRLDRLSPDLLDLMKRAGMEAVKVGIESALPEKVECVSRIPDALEHQEEIIRHCHRRGIKVIAFYLLGLPEDTEDSIRHTMDYACRMNTFIAQFHICTPLPGTPLFDEMKDRITEKDWERFNNFEVVFRHDNLAADQLLKLKEEAFLSYYYRPGYMWSFLKRILAS